MLGGRLPDPGDDLSADPKLTSLVPGHHALGRRDDRRAHAALDLGNVRVVDVVPLPGTGDTLNPADHRLAVVRVLERNSDPLARMVRCLANLVRVDVALLLEDSGQLAL
jgi:hypothetical protein